MSAQARILITGASTGIGEALAREAINRNYAVYGTVRKEADAERLSKEFGDSFKALIFDVTDHNAIEEAAKQLEEKLGERGLDILVNNAGIAVGGPLQHIPMDEIRYQFEVNVFGAIKMMQSFAPLLGARENHGNKPGKIINVSSVAGQVCAPFLAPYVGSKHALEGISNSLRRELMVWGIDVIVVGPGAVKTPIWDKAEELDPYANTAYSKAFAAFRKIFTDTGEGGEPASDLARKMMDAVESGKPKTRYAFVKEKFRNYTLPRLLPPRLLDKGLARSMGLPKK